MTNGQRANLVSIGRQKYLLLAQLLNRFSFLQKNFCLLPAKKSIKILHSSSQERNQFSGIMLQIGIDQLPPPPSPCKFLITYLQRNDASGTGPGQTTNPLIYGLCLEVLTLHGNNLRLCNGLRHSLFSYY